MTTIPPSLFRKLTTTPLSDIVRGRLTCRLAWREVIDTADLPDELKTCIHQVVKKTRLWRSEKYEVAQELTGHFRDGLDAGVDELTLRDRFGNTKVAAKLIRRAKIRNRPMLWHIWWRSLQVVCILPLVYLLIALYFGLQSPNVTVDYLAKINDPIRAIPESEKAWPLYRDAWMKYGVPVRPLTGIQKLVDKNWVDIRPYGSTASDWPRAHAWLAENQTLIKSLREAADKPSFGFIYDQEFVQDPVNWPLLKMPMPQYATPTKPGAGLAQRPSIGMTAPYYSMAANRPLADAMTVLRADMFDAGWLGDGERLIADYKALFGVARHLAEPGFAIDQFSAISTVAKANAALIIILSTQIDKLDNQALISLAHLSSSLSKQLKPTDLAVEKMILQDIIQRVYTDDGNGDGYLTVSGWIEFARTWAPPAQMPDVEWVTAVLKSPLYVLSNLTRRDANEFIDGYFVLLQADAGKPLWMLLGQKDHPSIDYYHTFLKTRAKPLQYSNFGVMSVVPMLGDIETRRARALVHSDVICVAIALELYKRKEGAYPASLSLLTPLYLPTSPVDPSTGLELLLRYENGKPILYGRGSDGKDDGGKLPQLLPGEDESFPGPKPEDWVLYPIIVREP